MSEKQSIERERLLATLARATAIVDAWPWWKQGLLAEYGSATKKPTKPEGGSL